MEYHSALEKEGNPATRSNTDKPGGYHAKRNKPDSEGQILPDAI